MHSFYFNVSDPEEMEEIFTKVEVAMILILILIVKFVDLFNIKNFNNLTSTFAFVFLWSVVQNSRGNRDRPGT